MVGQYGWGMVGQGTLRQSGLGTACLVELSQVEPVTEMTNNRKGEK